VLGDVPRQPGRRRPVQQDRSIQQIDAVQVAAGHGLKARQVGGRRADGLQPPPLQVVGCALQHALHRTGQDALPLPGRPDQLRSAAGHHAVCTDQHRSQLAAQSLVVLEHVAMVEQHLHCRKLHAYWRRTTSSRPA
jgi:hypothetical protein